MDLEELRYPVGRYEVPAGISHAELRRWVGEIERLPADLRAAVEPLSDAQLDTPYRPGGWRVRQVVHHLADSHVNGYVRFKLTLTEEQPLVKTYHEERWAELSDAADAPIDASLRLLDALHERWVRCLRGLDEGELRRAYLHPELGAVPLDGCVGLYAWHGRHHLAHVTRLAQRQGWSGC